MPARVQLRLAALPALKPGARAGQRVAVLPGWIKAWREKNAALDLHINAPDAWRSKYQLALGATGAAVVRPNQRREMDSTRADLLLADGGWHVIVGVIDVWSRRLKLLVSRSSTSAAVCGLLRRALVDWRAPEGRGQGPHRARPGQFQP